jgi:hypothetical protein
LLSFDEEPDTAVGDVICQITRNSRHARRVRGKVNTLVHFNVSLPDATPLKLRHRANTTPIQRS